MIPFPSPEWTAALKDALNANPSFKGLGAGWRGDLLLVLMPDDSFRHETRIHLDLRDGSCLQASLAAAGTPAAFTLEGPFTVWRRILQGELDFFRALVRGYLTLEGDGRQIMDYAHAARELICTAGRLPVTYRDSP